MPATEIPTQVQVTAPPVQVESMPNDSKAMDTPQNNLTTTGDASEHMPPPDWDAIAKSGQDLSKQFDPNQPEYKPVSVRDAVAKEKAKEDEQRVEADEEGEEKGEGEKVQGEEGETPGNELPEDKADERGDLKAEEIQAAIQTQAAVDPLTQRYPEAPTFMKKMDKSAREWVKSNLSKSLKVESELAETKKALTLASQGKRQIPDSYYENPHAYVLLPEYHEAVTNESLAAQVAQHWQQQRVNLLNGEEWQDAQIVIDPTTKQYVLQQGQPQKFSKQGQLYVENALDHASRQYAKMAGAKEAIEGGFQETVQARLSKVAEVQDTFFPPDRWGKEGTNETKVMRAVEEDIKAVGISPTNPAFGLLARTTAALMMERNWREQQQRKTTKVAEIQKDVKKAGPTGSATSSGGGKAAGAKSIEEEWVKPFQFGNGNRF